MTPRSAQAHPDYITRINRGIDYVLQNLDQPLSLQSVAAAAAFSPFHFHRVFKSLIGESLNDFIKRVRLERALTLLSRKAYSQSSLTEIALACGFSSSSDFSRCFKQRFDVPPSQFDATRHRITTRASWQSAVADPETRHLLDRLPPGQNPDGFHAEILALPPRAVAYLRVHDSFRSGAVPDAAVQFLSWASSRQIETGQWLGYMWDDPEIVPYQKCRYDIGLVVDSFEPEPGYGCITFPAMTVASVTIRGTIDLEQRALDWLFQTWLPNSGYLPSDQPCFEAWHGLPYAHGLKHFELDIHLPVEKTPAAL